jgi:flagellar hook-length control protein FliK
LRLSLSELNGVMTLSITAERPETADLIRRHLVLLADEFTRQGLDAPSVDISNGGGQQGQDARAAEMPAASEDAGADSAPPLRATVPMSLVRLGVGGGLDLRL